MGIVLKATRSVPEPHRGDQSAEAGVGGQRHGQTAISLRGPGRGGDHTRSRGHDPRGGRGEPAAVHRDGVHCRRVAGGPHSRTGPLQVGGDRGSACRPRPAWQPSQGLVHRNVKPSNILLENGVERVKLVDFGFRRATDDLRITQSGVVAGTPEYMSPEQTRTQRRPPQRPVQPTASVLYAMCTGRSPFRAPRSSTPSAASATTRRGRFAKSTPRSPTGWSRSSIACWPRRRTNVFKPRPKSRRCSASALPSCSSPKSSRVRWHLPQSPVQAPGESDWSSAANRRGSGRCLYPGYHAGKGVLTA